MKKLLPFLFVVLVIGCKDKDKPADGGDEQIPTVPAPAIINYSVVNVYPHDTSSFTEGLQWHDGALYEGTGEYGKSHLLKVSLKDGKILKKLPLDKVFFGEGITVLNGKIYQLTYKEHKVFVYDEKTWNKIKEFSWQNGEGWGMTTDGKQLIISTGSSNLYFVNPETFQTNKIVSVNSNYGPVANVNELEWVNGKIYANVFETPYIIKIDAESGKVEGRMDLTDILRKHGKDTEPTNVLNGIAYDSTKNFFYVTGKNWPALFEIKLN
jgi:glutamine cyclotransferase